MAAHFVSLTLHGIMSSEERSLIKIVSFLTVFVLIKILLVLETLDSKQGDTFVNLNLYVKEFFGCLLWGSVLCNGIIKLNQTVLLVQEAHNP